MFEESKQVESFSAHLECTFKNTAETLLVDAKKLALTARRKVITLGKKYQRSSVLLEGRKMRVFFGDVFLNDWNIPPKVQNWEKNFSLRRKPNCCSVNVIWFVEKSAEIFCAFFDKKCSSSEKKNWESKKKTRAFSSASWRHFWKHCWKPSCRSSSIQAQSPKKNKISGKKSTKKPSAHEKWKIEIFPGELFLREWKVDARSTWLKKRFIWKNFPVSPLHTYWTLLRSVLNNFLSNCERKFFGVWEER